MVSEVAVPVWKAQRACASCWLLQLAAAVQVILAFTYNLL